MKKLIIIVLSIAIIVFIAYLSLFLLGKHIYNRSDCERFNIDNIEMRTHVNIPSVVLQDCNCQGNIKISNFKLTSDIDLEDYVKKNRFSKENGIYVNKGEQEDTQWNISLNPKTLEMNVWIEYK